MMEKQSLPQDDASVHISEARRTAPANKARRFVILTLILSFLSLGQWLSATSTASGLDSYIEAEPAEASEDLQYFPCYSNDHVKFECARLKVPLDYFNETTNATISLAIIRLPAAVPPTDPRYGGAILFNPGGPGGSGVGFLQRAYKQLRAVIQPTETDGKLYDFISFDPRGIGASEPQLRCFKTGAEQFLWEVRSMQEGNLGSSNAAFGRLWSMVSAYAGSCSLSALQDEHDIKKYVTTASVATDMLSIIEAHGRWRESAAQKIQKALPDHIKHKPGHEKLNYWGFSYGTYLGMTFASMYPDRVHRLVIDGVVDAIDYKKSLWYDNLADTEKEMSTFYSYCAEAGYPSCVLANKTGSTSSEVEERVKRITDSLVHNPLPVIAEQAEVITYSDVKNVFFAGLYSPLQSFPYIASLLVDIETGDGTAFAELLRPYHELACPSYNQIEALGRPLRNSTSSSLDRSGTMAIACTDGDSQANYTRDDLKEHWHKLAKISPTIGPQWSLFRMHCVKYAVRANYRFEGPFAGDTAHPMLFIGNSADPVTPVRNARKMAKGFKDARVVEQGSDGHCSSAAKSDCTSKIIRRYFQDGSLPEKDTFCKADELPFGAPIALDTASELIRARMTNGGLGHLMPLV